jgi:hypothetical protein
MYVLRKTILRLWRPGDSAQPCQAQAGLQLTLQLLLTDPESTRSAYLFAPAHNHLQRWHVINPLLSFLRSTSSKHVGDLVSEFHTRCVPAAMQGQQTAIIAY